MPIIALGTMNCKTGDHGGGFADHSAIGGFIVDFLFLGVFVFNALWLQEKIVRHTLIGQLGFLKRFKFFDQDISGVSPWLWYRIMQVLTVLNLLNVWTNAEVLGRVLATFQYCPEARSWISESWEEALKNTMFAKVFPDSNSILVLS